MKQELISKLARLNADYESVAGHPFKHFLCPVLFCDEKTELCKAHIINTAFRASSRRWTIQRKDVDSFFGSLFESDFVTIQDMGKHHLPEVLMDKDLSRKQRPQVFLNGKPVEHYIPDGKVPPEHSQSILGDGEDAPHFVLKLPPEKTMAALDGDWDIRIEKDIRLAALPSLLKAAHLTLFDMLGYKYGLSLSGRFVGHDILGRFFLENRGKTKSEILKNAPEHFKEFVNMVRPVESAPPGFKGTATDHLLFLCMSGERPWALIILIKTGDMLHAVLVPAFDAAENSARFLRFIENPFGTIEARLVRYVKDHWDLFPENHKFFWPDANFD